MRIGIDGRGIRPEPDGIGRYTSQLIRATASACPNAEIVVWCLPSALDSIPRLDRLRSVILNRHHLSRFTVRRFGGHLDREQLDVFHSPFFVAPVRCRCSVFVTVHDLMALRFPDFFEDSPALVSWYKRSFHKKYVPMCVRTAERVLTVSRWVAGEVEQLGVEKDKIRILPDAVDPRFTKTSSGSDHDHLKELGLEPGFFLHVGRWKRYKNLPLLLEAYQHYVARTARRPARLVLVRGGGGDPRVEVALDRLQLRSYVHVLERVADRYLPSVYRSALALLQPSVCEGFGLPVIEAMASGTPVVCSNGGALPEVAGDAGLIIKGNSADDWAKVLERLAQESDLRAELSSKGLNRAAAFRLENMSGKLKEIYREIGLLS